MPKAKMNISKSGSRKRKVYLSNVENVKTITIPAKAVVVRRGSGRKAVAVNLIHSMDLDEMLEASKVVEMGLKGEKLPVVKSPKVQRYVGTVLRLNKRVSTKRMAKRMQQDLNVRIIDANRKTANVAKGRQLYHALMQEE